jgi:cyclophilin family peptidyl-prolyl cis-trans isomerase
MPSMTMRKGARGLCATLCLVSALSAHAQRDATPTPLRARMLAAEDARPRMPDSGALSRPSTDPLAPLYDGLTSLPEIQVLAVRGLGRQERPDLVSRIAPLLNAISPAVRAEAANALAQAISRGGETADVFDLLRIRASRERDAGAGAALARSVGRPPYRTAAEAVAAQALLVSLLNPPPQPRSTAAPPPAAIATIAGVAAGLESMARRTTPVAPIGEAGRAALAQLSRVGLDAGGREVLPGAGAAQARQIRRLAISALTSAGGLTQALVTAAASDADTQVRRLAIAGVGRLPVAPWVLDALERAIFDTDPRVRVEALRQRGAAGGRVACQAARVSMGDDNLHVALAAIDLAGSACGGEVAAVGALDALAVPPNDTGNRAWHRAAHALVALARLMPDRTRARLAPFVAHPGWHIRQYTARAASAAGATGVLETLARDADDNVRDAALVALARRVDRRGDPLFIAALGRPDGQLVRTAALALAGTPRRSEAARALVDALARLTAELRETSRDVRIAILDRLEETGAALPFVRDEMAACLIDFDPVVAARAAAILSRWRGVAVRAQPRPLPRLPLPGLERLADLGDTLVIVSMARGGVWRMRLLPEEAPTNVSRFVRMSASGAFNGLTFHRVEPTFVIQGGSPRANEYAGEGPFSRDEVGLRSHLRGTVGISTRGRDTGDGQIFVNLVDNVRLDHNYTIIGQVIEGMDVVDGIVEGDVIERMALERVR